MTPISVRTACVGGFLLELPIDFAVQRDPSFFDFDLDGVGGNGRVPGQTLDSRAGDVLVAASDVIGKLDLDFLGHGPHAFHPSRRPLRRDLLCEALDVPGQGHDAGVRGDADMRSVDARLPAEFGHHRLLELSVL